jgi:hypothetical protein
MAHKFAQIIGDVLEESLRPILGSIFQRHGLYLDCKGARPARAGQKVTWKDLFGNLHDLDYVLERGGTRQNLGQPVAFIEIAWRRYTKHSRNKAQELQGAILPLKVKHTLQAPFIGAVLAGEFTHGAIQQLRSEGFQVVYLPYSTIVQAFATQQVNALFDEHTPEREFAARVRAWRKLPEARRRLVAEAVIRANQKAVDDFIAQLESAINRRICLVRVTPLHGAPVEKTSVQDAIEFIAQYEERHPSGSFIKYEIEVRYTNGDRIQAEFRSKADAVGFLRTQVRG